MVKPVASSMGRLFPVHGALESKEIKELISFLYTDLVEVTTHNNLAKGVLGEDEFRNYKLNLFDEALCQVGVIRRDVDTQ